MAEVICVGEALVDLVPRDGATCEATEVFLKAAGGAPANVAVGVARLGVSSGFIGCVGDDGLGRFLATTLRRAGVDITGLRTTREAPTALSLVTLSAGGEREFLFYGHPAAHAMMEPADIDEDAIRRAGILHFGAIGLIAEPSRSATRHAIALARRHGTLVSFDPNLRPSLWPDAGAARADALWGLSHASIVKIGEDELTEIAGIGDAVNAARRLWHPMLRLMAITRGSRGCLWVTANGTGACEGFSIDPVDTTGAGDAFTAALLSQIVTRPDAYGNPETLRSIIRFAAAAGALATLKHGAIPALPERDAVEALVHAQVSDG